MELLAEERQTGATSGGKEPHQFCQFLIDSRQSVTHFAASLVLMLCVFSDPYVPLIGGKRSDERLLLSPSEGLDTVDEQESTIERGVSVSRSSLNILNYIDELDSGVHRGGNRERLSH